MATCFTVPCIRTMSPSPSHHRVSRGQIQQSSASGSSQASWEEPCPWVCSASCPSPRPSHGSSKRASLCSAGLGWAVLTRHLVFSCAHAHFAAILYTTAQGPPRTAKPCTMPCREPQGTERLAQAKAESLYISSIQCQSVPGVTCQRRSRRRLLDSGIASSTL